MKKIAVLTSGGDAPGMNAAIRSVVLKGKSMGMEVYGVRYGFRGLVNGDFKLLEEEDVFYEIQEGGTMLYTARYPEFLEEEIQRMAISKLEEKGIEGLIIIGGDGSYAGALDLSNLGFPTISLPGTIDNDVGGTDYSIGFDTALRTTITAVDQIRDTATSHDRLFIIEVMGRKAGDIAFWTGVATGSEQIIVPEIDFTFEEVAEKIRSQRKEGKKRFLIVLSEGVMKGHAFADKLDEIENFNVRVTELGHVQRGGSPSPKDRALATRFGSAAVEYLDQGYTGGCIGIVENKVKYTDVKEALKKESHFLHEIEAGHLDFVF